MRVYFDKTKHDLLRVCCYIYSAKDAARSYGSTLMPVYISDHMSSSVWDAITYPFPNLNGYTVMDVNTYPYRD